VDDRPENPVASRLYHSYSPTSTRESLYGTAIVMGADGDADASVPESVITRWRRVARECEVEGYVRGLREQGDPEPYRGDWALDSDAYTGDEMEPDDQEEEYPRDDR
jgi:hypothetical protein